MTYQIIANPPATIFRAYDIRGVVTHELTPDMVYTIGLAFGSELQQRGETKIAIARDGRLSGPELLEALTAGLVATGCQVTNFDMLPTAVLYFATFHYDIPNCIMLTGSHNPSEYNGIKMVVQHGAVTAEMIQDLYQRIRQRKFTQGDGQITQQTVVDEYIDYIKRDITLKKPLNVVIDCGNGVTGMLAGKLFRALGCEVTELFCEVDGNFPNHHPDPSVPENLIDLIAKVKATNADIGLAFDGDGDRLGVVTADGEMIYPDRQLILFAKDVLSRHPGTEIFYDVKCTRYMDECIKHFGGIPTMWQTGHSILKAKLNNTENALLAGEMSGHIFFKERWFGFDDGLYASARLLEIIDQDGRSSTEIFADIPQGVATPELSIDIADNKKFAVIDQLIAKGDFNGAEKITIDGLRVEYPDGWGLVRCSNTTPKITLRFEADNEQALKRIIAQVNQQLQLIDADLTIKY
jgi:phosphomannomutase/phosphoglucomutase